MSRSESVLDLFKGRHFNRKVIVLCVRWYLSYKLSSRDLADVHANVDQGCHIASMGGTWMATVYGLAGMRDQNGRITFHPRFGQRVKGLRSIWPSGGNS
jgi:hypothetical protein